MNIGLIDVDNWQRLDNCFPNIALMKLSAFYKNNGDIVEWYDSKHHYDIVYMSKVFSFSNEPEIEINADKIIKGGTGYYIKLNDGKEFLSTDHYNLNDEIEHQYPDYSLYNINDIAYGFMSRGCPRGCFFCHVASKEGRISYKVADLNEFWNGQKYIELMDPNTLACRDWKDILKQLIESRAYVNFNQGVDIRLLNDEKWEYMQQIKIKSIHFAWDRYEDRDIITKNLLQFKKLSNWNRNKVTVYVLTNYNTTIEQDIERVMFIRSLNFQPYIMRYDKEHIKRGSLINSLARWVNNNRIFWVCPTFNEYLERR